MRKSLVRRTFHLMYRLLGLAFASLTALLVSAAAFPKDVNEKPHFNEWQTSPILRAGLVLLYPMSRAKEQIPTPDYFAAACPSWSPKHDRIAYSWLEHDPALSGTYPNRPHSPPRPDSEEGIYIVNRDGKEYCHVTNSFDDSPSWSPDGSKIAFTRFRDFLFPQIDIYDIKSGKISQFTKSDELCMHPAWSPDGKQIAFTSLTPHSWTIKLQNTDTQQSKTLKNTPVGYYDFARWSPDSKRLLVVYSNSRNWYPQCSLLIIDSDSRFIRRLPLRRIVHSPAAWSPDRKRIAYIAWTRPGAVALYYCDSNGQNVCRLSPPPGVYYDRDEWPDW